LTGSSSEPAAAHVVYHSSAHRTSAPHVAHRVHASVRYPMAQVRTHYPTIPVSMPAAPMASRDEAVAWVPVSMPMSSMPFASMRDHAQGNLVVHLVVDGQGQVAQATLAQSSGDAVLDAHALAMAQTWRFAVPADRPYGFSGDLPLSFAPSGAQFAQMP
jgi:periplasmic protein TonB